jgi:thiamine-phosphate pyrophosphorylase
LAISYYITSRSHWPDDDSLATLISKVADTVAAGIDYVQVREKDLSGAELLRLAEACGTICAGTATRLLVNGRADVAAVAGANGFHLSSAALPLTALRGQLPGLQIVGVSCHNEQEVAEATQAGVDYILLGPVYETPSKPGAVPLGLERFAGICAQTPVPVYALGGVSRDNAAACVGAGAKGVAGIRLFQTAADLKVLIAKIRAL